MARTKRLDPRALHRVERRGGEGLGGAGGGVELLAVVLHPQSIGVGKTARLGDLVGGQGTRRRRHLDRLADLRGRVGGKARSEEHTSELQSLMRISYAVFCLKKKKQKDRRETTTSNQYHN